jgi:hypothetical protein
MSKSTTNTDSKTPAFPAPTTNTPAPAAVVPPVEAAPVDSNTDDFGYDDEPKAPAAVVPPVEDKKPEEPAKPTEKSVTGYGNPPEPEIKPEDKKPEEPAKPDDQLTEEEKAQKEIESALTPLGTNYDKDKITKFAKDNKMTKAQVEAYVKLVQDDEKEIVKANEAAVKTQRAAWTKELENDPEFGGENFVKNVDRVGKVLQDYMPNMKKVLTDKGSMLPPYIMRDLLGLAKHLNPTTTFVTGDAPAPAEDDGNYLDDMYSY